MSLGLLAAFAGCSSPAEPSSGDGGGGTDAAPSLDAASPPDATPQPPPPPSCGVGAPLGAGASAGVGATSDTAGFATITACGNVNTSSVLAADLTGDCSCLTIKAPNVVVEGAGHTITMTGGVCSGEGPFAFFTDQSGGVLRNLRSNASVRSYGASNNTFEQLEVGGLSLYSGSSHAVRNSKLGGLSVSGEIAPIDHVTVEGNDIEGTGSEVVDIIGGTVDPCPDTHHVFHANLVINTSPTFAPDGAAKGVYLRCSRQDEVTDNVIQTLGYGQALRLRDEADFNVIEHNTLLVGGSGPGDAAFKMSSGNADKTFPANNTIRYNLVATEGSYAIDTQATGGGNLFAYDVFWATNAWEGARLSSSAGDTFDHDTFAGSSSHALILDSLGNGGLTFTNDIVARYGAPDPTTYALVTGFDGPPDVSKYAGGGNVFFDALGPGTYGAPQQPLAWWQANMPGETTSKEADPKFTDVQQGKFTLASGSPAAGAGAYPASCTP